MSSFVSSNCIVTCFARHKAVVIIFRADIIVALAAVDEIAFVVSPNSVIAVFTVDKSVAALNRDVIVSCAAVNSGITSPIAFYIIIACAAADINVIA